MHDTKKQGLITSLIAISRAKGRIACVGDGKNRWPAAHVSDVARLYALFELRTYACPVLTPHKSTRVPSSITWSGGRQK